MASHRTSSNCLNVLALRALHNTCRLMLRSVSRIVKGELVDQRRPAVAATIPDFDAATQCFLLRAHFSTIQSTRPPTANIAGIANEDEIPKDESTLAEVSTAPCAKADCESGTTSGSFAIGSLYPENQFQQLPGPGSPNCVNARSGEVVVCFHVQAPACRSDMQFCPAVPRFGWVQSFVRFDHTASKFASAAACEDKDRGAGWAK